MTSLNVLGFFLSMGDLKRVAKHNMLKLLYLHLSLTSKAAGWSWSKGHFLSKSFPILAHAISGTCGYCEERTLIKYGFYKAVSLFEIELVVIWNVRGFSHPMPPNIAKSDCRYSPGDKEISPAWVLSPNFFPLHSRCHLETLHLGMLSSCHILP